jgi:hypothetical protein
MSDLWNVTVTEKKENMVKLLVREAHSDAGSFPNDPVFAMQLLTKTAYRLNDDHQWEPGSSLGHEFDHSESFQPFDLSGKHEKYIKEFKVISAKSLRDEDIIDANITKKLQEEGFQEGDDDWDVEYEIAYDEYFDDPENRPRAEYEIHVTDAKWIEHLSPDDNFYSAAWSETGPFIKEEI